MKIKFLGVTSERSLKRRVKNVAGAGKLSHFYGDVFEVINSSEGYNEDLKVIDRIIRSGHKSIIEHDYIQIGISEVTPIVEQILIGFRLTAFTIKSRRYVDFRKVGFYVPNFRNIDGTLHIENDILKKKYKRHANSLFRFYSEMVDGGIPKEDARFILPYSFYSDIFMSLNARELEKMIIYLLYGENSRIKELHDLGIELLNIAKEYVPYIVKYIENYKIREDAFNYRATFKQEIEDNDVLDKPVLLDYTSEPDNAILKYAIMSEAQCDCSKSMEFINNFEHHVPGYKARIMDEIIRKSENRELEQVSFTWQIPISLSILTHLTRHRMHSLIVPSFIPIWNFNNYVVPDTVKKSSFFEKYYTLIQNNKKLMEKFRTVGVIDEDLIYFYLGCQMCNVVTTMNGRELMWISRMRGCHRAQWQIREIANCMMDEIGKVAPLFRKGLGPTCEVFHYCPEGKLSCGYIKEVLEREKEK